MSEKLNELIKLCVDTKATIMVYHEVKGEAIIEDFEGRLSTVHYINGEWF